MATQSIPNSASIQTQHKVVASEIFVSIRSPESSQFEGEARALTTINDKGVFDILPEHENFISLVRDKVTIHLKDGKTKELKIETGVMKVFENKVFILLGIERIQE